MLVIEMRYVDQRMMFPLTIGVYCFDAQGVWMRESGIMIQVRQVKE